MLPNSTSALANKRLIPVVEVLTGVPRAAVMVPGSADELLTPVASIADFMKVNSLFESPPVSIPVICDPGKES
jgi:hypothetical protein